MRRRLPVFCMVVALSLASGAQAEETPDICAFCAGEAFIAEGVCLETGVVPETVLTVAAICTAAADEPPPLVETVTSDSAPEGFQEQFLIVQ